MDLVNLVNQILGIGIIVSQVFIVFAIIYIILPFKKDKISGFFAENGRRLAFLVSVVATCGSLFYSNYAGFTPCVLCWYQRIFMYPEVVLLGLSLLKEDDKIIDYSLLLSIIGWLVSVYHNYIYFQGLNSTVCITAESCTTPYVTEFGYITIPVMALTAFTLIILFLIIKKYGKKI